jgi:hypothetical protein
MFDLSNLITDFSRGDLRRKSWRKVESGFDDLSRVGGDLFGACCVGRMQLRPYPHDNYMSPLNAGEPGF